MIQKLATIKILWLLIAVLSLVAALVGIVRQDIYRKVVSINNLPGTISQDVVSLIAALLMIVLVIRLKETDIIKPVIILGLIGHLWYGYGIYVIEQVYTVLHLVYMAIFGLASYALAHSVGNIRPEMLTSVQVTKPVRIVAVGWSLFTPLLFCPLWIGMLLPLIRTGQKPEALYSVFILDLCFVMPAFVIVAVLTAKNKGLGLLLTPVLFVKGFTLLFSVGLGSLFKPLYHQTMTAEVGLYLSVALVFLVLAVAYLRNLKIHGV